MSVRSVKSSCQVGLDFYEFLKETDRASITAKDDLKEIYNDEFRNRKGLKDPNFGSVLYALRSYHKVTKCNGNVWFNSKVKRLYRDQWHSPRAQQPVQNGTPGPSPGPLQCPVGETGIRARRQLASLLMVKLKTDKAQFISDKNGVTITSDHECTDTKICLCVEDYEEHVVRLCVKNTGTMDVVFTYYTLLNWLKYFALDDQNKVTRASPLTLAPGDNYEIKVLFRTALVGFYPATLAFEFKPTLPDSAAFHIIRFIEVQCVTSLGKELAPIAPYKPCFISAQVTSDHCEIVDGQRPEGQSVMRLQIKAELKRYNVPAYVQRLIDSLKGYSSHCNASTSGKRELLEAPLSMENYSEKFRLLLFLEELQMEVDIQKYNIPNNDREHATMCRDTINKKLLVLDLPGVTENRPSVLRGDKLLMRPKGENGLKYCGYVHAVELDKVKLGFSSQLLDRFVDGMSFCVEFTVSRLTVRLQHRAAELATQHGLGEVLFPELPEGPTSAYRHTELPSLRLFDRQLEQNPQQYQAVQHIVAGSSKPAPYLVFGPPGTGKTVTVVEAIKQLALQKTQASCHILACAPSNSASDLLCKKILDHVDEHMVYRMYASSLDPRRVPTELKACSNLEGDTYVYPSKEELMTYKIIVTTLFTAGRLVTGGVPPGHFSHVFVDEAGHAVETECIIPIAGLLQVTSGQVVLAGDPKQLGPILRSPLALKYELGVSLLERLMKSRPVYQKRLVHDKDLQHTFDSRFVTKLLCNYRSHPAILKIPNDLFYDGELQVCANEMIRNSYCHWEYLPKKGFPVVFHGVTGLDEREATSPSFFNVAEVEMLMDYVRKLLETQGKMGLSKLSPREIGIIAPYRKQVQKIRKGLERVEKDLKVKDMRHLKVGSVEEFQGQERKVILVSTVRSSPKYLELDQKFTLGFVKNEKRFNVAVTRAKALLIMVGNPRVLCETSVWRSFIQYCTEEGGYTGFSYTEEEEDVVARLAALCIVIEPQVETEESVVQQQLDPEWRNEQ